MVVHQKLWAYKPAPLFTGPSLPVSVIICARNEEKNLKKNLELVLNQDYPDFEVVVVNDCSVDDSGHYLRTISGQYPNLKVVTITEHDRFKHGKKFAATLGIKAAKHECLLFTDADCRPASPNWINLMQRNFSSDTEIVLGYSPYVKLAGFVNKLVRIETFFTAINYLSFAISGNPYMGVGRNLAYRKSLFFRGKGFASHMHIPSGDDDLFVNQNANSVNTAVEIHPDAMVWSDPKETLISYITQKLRHLGAGGAYRAEHKRTLTIQAASAILFYLCIPALLLLNAQWWLLTILYLIRMTVQLLVYWPILKKLAHADLLWWFPLFDLVYYISILALNFISLFKKKVQWR